MRRRLTSAFDPKRTFTSPLLKRRYRINLVEHPQHDAVGGGLAVERSANRPMDSIYDLHINWRDVLVS